MGMIQTAGLQKEYDVIVVGSGAAGGQTAYTLTHGRREGADARGRPQLRSRHRNADVPDATPRRRCAARRRPTSRSAFYDATIDGGWQVPGEPYTSALGRPGAATSGWWRARMLGGRTNHWGRISLRNGPYDFKPHTRDGLGFDWPISYEDLAPYYDKVEMLIGVYGDERRPGEHAELLAGRAAAAAEAARQRAADRSSARRRSAFRSSPAHRAVLTQQLDHKRCRKLLHPGNAKAQRILAEHMRSARRVSGRRPAAAAARSGRTTSRRRCTCRRRWPPAISTSSPTPWCARSRIDKRRQARPASSTSTRHRRGASREGARRRARRERAARSVRILLNSKSRVPAGLANSSGKVGKYLMDTVGAVVGGQMPALENLPPHNEDGAGGVHMYSPWWLYKEQLAGKLGFARGYHIEFGGGRRMPGMGTAAGSSGSPAAATASKFKEDARRYYGSFVGFAGRGEMIPNEDCYCEIDPNVKDKWGIPVLRFHWKWSEHETRQAAHMQKTFAEIIDAMGGKVLGTAAADGARRSRRAASSFTRSAARSWARDPKKSVDQPVAAELGREEPVHHRRRAVLLERGQEPDADDHGAGVALGGLHAAGDEEKGPLI